MTSPALEKCLMDTTQRGAGPEVRLMSKFDDCCLSITGDTVLNSKRWRTFV